MQLYSYMHKIFLNYPQELKFDKGIEITIGEALVLSPLQQKDGIYLMTHNITTGIYTIINYVICIQLILMKVVVRISILRIKLFNFTTATCKLFFFNAKVSILTGKASNKMWKLSL